MATTRIKDLTNTATTVASDEYLAVDGTTNGTSKITRDNFRQDTADAFVAAPGTYNLAPLSGGAVPIDKGGTAATTAAGARTSLDVPSNSEAVLAANNLSDVTAATARTNLSVNSVDEDAEATGTKLVGPSLYFDGSNDYVEVADSDKLSFTDGTDDLPFSVSAWVKMGEVANDPIVCKYGTSNPNREWLLLISSGKVALYLHDGSVEINASTVDTITAGQWFHVAVTYAGTSSGSFASAADNISIHINGKVQSVTRSNHASYAGMPNTAQALWVGRYSNTYSKGHIRNVQIFNRELTATEVAQLARGTDLGFADEWGGALGGVYTQDSTPSGEWTANAGTDADEAGPIGGRSNVLKFTVDSATSSHYLQLGAVFTVGKRYRIDFDVFIPSQSNVDGVNAFAGGFINNLIPSASTWTKYSQEVVATFSGLRLYATEAGATTVTDSGGDDVIYIDGLTITEIGTLADFRAESYDEDTGKLYDISDNAFVGTGTSVTLTGRAYPVYETGTWTPSVTFGGGSTGITYGAQEGYYTRIGNQVTIHGSVTLTSKGTDKGQFKIAGLPYTSANTSGSLFSACIGYSFNWDASITAQPALVVADNDTTLFGTVALSGTLLTDTAFSNTTVLRFSATYQIQ